MQFNETKAMEMEVAMFQLEQRVEAAEMGLARMQTDIDVDMLTEKICYRADLEPNIYMPKMHD